MLSKDVGYEDDHKQTCGRRKKTILTLKFDTVEKAAQFVSQESPPSTSLLTLTNYPDTVILLAQHILSWYLDVVERHVGGTCSRGVRSLDRSGFNAFAAGDEEDSEAIIGLRWGCMYSEWLSRI